MSQWASRVRCWSVNMKTTSCCNTVNFREQCRMIPNYSYLCPITHKNCHMATEPHKTGNDNDNSKKKRKSKDNLAYGIAMGMLGGTALGSAFDDLAL